MELDGRFMQGITDGDWWGKRGSGVRVFEWHGDDEKSKGGRDASERNGGGQATWKRPQASRFSACRKLHKLRGEKVGEEQANSCSFVGGN